MLELGLIDVCKSGPRSQIVVDSRSRAFMTWIVQICELLGSLMTKYQTLLINHLWEIHCIWYNINSCYPKCMSLGNKEHDSLSFMVMVVYPIKYAHCFVVLCFVVVLLSATVYPYWAIRRFMYIYIRLSSASVVRLGNKGKVIFCVTKTKNKNCKLCAHVVGHTVCF